jgi:hypothetical protein
MITQKMRNIYLQENGKFCVYCNKRSIVRTFKIDSHDYISFDTYCNSCKQSWIDIYSLVDVNEK